MRHRLPLGRWAARRTRHRPRGQFLVELAPVLPSRRGSRGQSLVEFALVIPILLLLTLTALDFGRVYLGWINLQNMSRVAANFASNNPTAWTSSDATAITRYRNQVIDDASKSNCQLDPGTPAPPTFTDTNGDGVATGVGDNASVEFTCRFQVITPIISGILGGSLNVSASSVFPVKAGMTGTGSGGPACVPPNAAIHADPTSGMEPLPVSFTDASGGGAGTSWLWDLGVPSDPLATSTLRDPGTYTYLLPATYTVQLTVTNACGTSSTTTTIIVGNVAPTTCTVPVLDGLRRNSAQGAWSQAQFTTTVQNGPDAPPGNYIILTQSIVAGSDVACDSPILVNDH